MLDRFTEIQQRSLEQRGLQQREQQERHQLERQRYDSLKMLQDQELPIPNNALSYQNQGRMRYQIGLLLDSQEQEVILAQKNHVLSQQALRAQFAKVKGLEVLAQRRAREKAVLVRRLEQRQTDDWLNRGRNR